jgi:hypothetical protein
MRQISFSIPVSGVIHIDGDIVTITVNKADTIVTLGPEVRLGGRLSLESGKTMFDIILETAREIVKRKGDNQFSAPELYYEASMNYLELKRNSFTSRVIASTPNHSSYKHYASKRDYFSYIGPGLYELNERYKAEKTTDEGRTLFNP